MPPLSPADGFKWRSATSRATRCRDSPKPTPVLGRATKLMVSTIGQQRAAYRSSPPRALLCACAFICARQSFMPFNSSIEATEPTMGNEIRRNSIGMKMALIRAGKFIMGSAPDEPGRDSDEGPPHVVHLSRDFWLGVYPVTQAEYEAVVGENYSKFRGAQNPVEMVNVSEINRFLDRLSEKEGVRYAL